ncbi:hypothetical protein EVAR_22487_1 [Eumeta japonica]|uniref:Uncharacterized protein n=1 Tax=Eumeta variegata TaxID=151549 RepID=A0A4C1VFB9_EUMVA|nr:hypothetical protein EVAR_22487_1 [Eumeta japonica]
MTGAEGSDRASVGAARGREMRVRAGRGPGGATAAAIDFPPRRAAAERPPTAARPRLTHLPRPITRSKTTLQYSNICVSTIENSFKEQTTTKSGINRRLPAHPVREMCARCESGSYQILILIPLSIPILVWILSNSNSDPAFDPDPGLDLIKF